MQNHSPLEQYCEQIDEKYCDYSYMWIYHNLAKKIDPNYLTRIFIDDLKYRANNQRNVVASIEGQQGCQPVGSKVLMATGEYKNIEDIVLGDEVVSLQYNGNVTFERVVDLVSWYCEDMYSIFSKRNNELLYSCSYNHLIPFQLDFQTNETGKTHKTRERYFTQLNVLGVPKEIINLQETQKTCRWSVKQGAYIPFFKDRKDCKINPYFLGVFLGDGCFTKTMLSITTETKMIVGCLNDEKVMRVATKPNNKASSYFYSTKGIYASQLKDLGLFGKKSGDKFIPKSALFSSAKYRSQLLSGLIDTDGFISKRNQIIITTKSFQLAKDIQLLVHSLGGNSTIIKTKKKCQIKNFVGTYYNVSVTLGANKNLLDLKVDFKAKRLFNKKGWSKQSMINFKVKKTKPNFVVGITITGNSKLYFTDNMTLTHNCGKSLFGVALSTILGNLFKNNFTIERDIYVNPSQLDYDLREGKNRRRTFFYDEQPSQNVGIGSVSTQLALRDYEEICRHTQNNLIYASPEIQEHAHYFVFKQVDYDPPRLVNKKCLDCPIHDDCVSNFYSTLCDIPFYKRNGYPLRFNFMLYTKRLADKIFIPRGVISLPMVHYDIALRYNVVKSKNIKNFEKYASDIYQKHLEKLDVFVKEYQDRLIKSKVNKVGVKVFSVQNKDVVEGWFYDYFSKGRYVTRDVEIYVALIKQKLEHIVEGLNQAEM